MFSEINKSKVNFTDLKNSEAVFGDGMTIEQRYPKSFTFAGYSDLDDGSIVVGTSFQEIIDQGTNETFLIEQFPYTVVSNINANPIRWGFFVNESFKRIFACMDSVNSYIEITRSSIKNNNDEVNRKFDSVVESIEFVSYNYLESTRHDTEIRIPNKNHRPRPNKIVNFLIEDISEEVDKALSIIVEVSNNEGEEYRIKNDIINTVNIKDKSVTPEKLNYGFSREYNLENPTKHVKSLTSSGEEIQTWVKDYEKNITSSSHAVSHKFLEYSLSGQRSFFDPSYMPTNENMASDGTTDSLSYATYIVGEINTVQMLMDKLQKVEYDADVYISSTVKESDISISFDTENLRCIRGIKSGELNIISNGSSYEPAIMLYNAEIDVLNIDTGCDIYIDKSSNIGSVVISGENVKLNTDIKTDIVIKITKKENNSNRLTIVANKANIELAEGSNIIDYFDVLYCDNILINN